MKAWAVKKGRSRAFDPDHIKRTKGEASVRAWTIKDTVTNVWAGLEAARPRLGWIFIDKRDAQRQAEFWNKYDSSPDRHKVVRVEIAEVDGNG